ncbi:hypothetical protein LUX33_20000 [Actinomadura madurae]|nr:hypothetical protein [Actinomadura madurae]MCP9950463.1 hypothetical protein [Actinomadura madurae]
MQFLPEVRENQVQEHALDARDDLNAARRPHRPKFPHQCRGDALAGMVGLVKRSRGRLPRRLGRQRLEFAGGGRGLAEPVGEVQRRVDRVVAHDQQQVQIGHLRRGRRQLIEEVLTVLLVPVGRAQQRLQAVDGPQHRQRPAEPVPATLLAQEGPDRHFGDVDRGLARVPGGQHGEPEDVVLGQRGQGEGRPMCQMRHGQDVRPLGIEGRNDAGPQHRSLADTRSAVQDEEPIALPQRRDFGHLLIAAVKDLPVRLLGHVSGHVRTG